VIPDFGIETVLPFSQSSDPLVSHPMKRRLVAPHHASCRCISQCEPAHIGSPPSRLIIGRGAWMCNMENRFDIVTIASAICVAGYVAIMLRHVALFDLGWSREAVRGGAMIAAILIAALVAVDFFGRNLRKAK
jgi:hypothetical protein